MLLGITIWSPTFMSLHSFGAISNPFVGANRLWSCVTVTSLPVLVVTFSSFSLFGCFTKSVNFDSFTFMSKPTVGTRMLLRFFPSRSFILILFITLSSTMTTSSSPLTDDLTSPTMRAESPSLRAVLRASSAGISVSTMVITDLDFRLSTL